MGEHKPTGRLMGLREIGARLNVGRQRAHQITTHPTFPDAHDVIHAGRVWLTEDVEAWIAVRRPEANANGKAP